MRRRIILFTLFRKQHHRRSFLKEVDNVDDAIKFFSQELYPFVGYDNKFFSTAEELKEYVESLRSKSRTKFDSTSADRPEISEGSDRELFESNFDNTESSSECDN